MRGSLDWSSSTTNAFSKKWRSSWSSAPFLASLAHFPRDVSATNVLRVWTWPLYSRYSMINSSINLLSVGVAGACASNWSLLVSNSSWLAMADWKQWNTWVRRLARISPSSPFLECVRQLHFDDIERSLCCDEPWSIQIFISKTTWISDLVFISSSLQRSAICSLE